LESEILKIARRVQSIAQSGIHFAENEFDRERYEECNTRQFIELVRRQLEKTETWSD
jgi:hypothetical protein